MESYMYKLTLKESKFPNFLKYLDCKAWSVHTWNDMKLGLRWIGGDAVIPVGRDVTHKDRTIIVHLWYHCKGALNQKRAPSPRPGDVGGQTEIEVLIQTRGTKFKTDGDIRFYKLHWTCDGDCRIFYYTGRDGQCWLWFFMVDSCKKD